MKRIIAFLIVMILCVSVGCPVFAADTEFVPSISYKGEPEVETIPDENGDPAVGVVHKDDEVIDYVYDGCLVITPISEAETSTDIPEDSRKELLDIYKELSSGNMELPYDLVEGHEDEDMVIRELIDASFLCGMEGSDHDHPTMLEPEGVVFTITFDLGVDADTDVVVMTYIDGQWSPIVSAVNNGDGTLTCTFEKLCPVVFSVAEDTYDVPAQTGDTSNVLLWGALMVVSMAALVVLVIVYRRKMAK